MNSNAAHYNVMMSAEMLRAQIGPGNEDEDEWNYPKRQLRRCRV
jgi:hypothetical protein